MANAETKEEEVQTPIMVTLKNNEVYQIVEIKGFSGENDVKTIEATIGSDEPQPVADVALALANQFMAIRAKESGSDNVSEMTSLGKAYKHNMSKWFTDNGFITFGYELDVDEPFADNIRIQFMAQKYVEAKEPEVKVVEKPVEKIVEKPVEKIVEKIVEVPADEAEPFVPKGLLSDEQAKKLKGKTLPPYLNGTAVINDLAFKDAFQTPITSVVFIVKTEDGIELKITDETLVIRTQASLISWTLSVTCLSKLLASMLSCCQRLTTQT